MVDAVSLSGECLGWLGRRAPGRAMRLRFLMTAHPLVFFSGVDPRRG